MERLNKFLIVLITLEIICGGGGRLLDPFGIPPLRYILFFIALLMIFVNVITMRSKSSNNLLVLNLSLFMLPLFGFFIGLIKGNEMAGVFFDVQPYLYILVVPFFCFLNSELKEYTILRFLSVTKFFSIFASVIYIAYVILLRMGLLNFNMIYTFMSYSTEFFFRPDGAFFAKSFFFIGIGAILFFCEKKYFSFLLCIAAIFLTETRGVFLFTGIAVMIASFKLNNATKNLALLLFAVIAVIGMLVVVGGRAADSDSVRFNDFKFVYDSMTPLGVVFGEGFGASIFGRGRIEVVPLEIFYKMGVTGIVLSVIPFIKVIVSNIFTGSNVWRLQIACSLIFGIGVSVTNPFIYTPMGIYLISISFISLTNFTHLTSKLSRQN